MSVLSCICFFFNALGKSVRKESNQKEISGFFTSHSREYYFNLKTNCNRFYIFTPKFGKIKEMNKL